MTDVLDAQYTEQTALAVAHESALAVPVATPDEARKAMAQYLALCEAILTPDDYQSFWQWDPTQRRKVEKKFKKKSAVKKLQTFYGLNVEVVREVKDDLPEGHYGFRVTARATTAGGKYSDASAACTSMEERFDLTQKDEESASAFESRRKKALARAYHDILSTAQTRACNRAVMDCLGLGGGEVTAEEVSKATNVPVEREKKPQRTKEEALRIERNERTKQMLAMAIELHVKGPFDIPVTDVATFLSWAAALVPGCENAAKGWKPTNEQIDACFAALEKHDPEESIL